MKKAKPSRWSKHYLYGISGFVLGFLLWRILPFTSFFASPYECPEEIPVFGNEPVNRDEVVEILGFDHPQLLEGAIQDPSQLEIYWESLTMTCSVINEKAYIGLVYPTGQWGWRVQLIYFDGNSPVLITVAAIKTGEALSYIGRDDGTGAIFADHNHNGRPEAILFFQGICNCMYGDLWILELMPDGTLSNIGPVGNGDVYSATDWNRDGLIDIVGENELFVAPIASFYNHLYPQHIYSWNGSAYTLVSVEIEGVSSESSARLALSLVYSNESICQRIADTYDTNDETIGISRTIFNVIYYYDEFLHEPERGWELVQPILDESAACPFDPSLPVFFSDMAVIREYFEGQ